MDCPCWNTSRSQQARKDIARSRRRSSRVGRGVELRNLIVVKPAVGFTLPSAGLSPAPSERRKMRDFVPGRSFLRSDHDLNHTSYLFCSPFLAGKGVRGIGRGGIVVSNPVPLPTMGRG